jgi:hypothetical protein
VANGASETEAEWLDLNKLVRREFCEEFILVQGKPGPGRRLRHVPLWDAHLRQGVGPHEYWTFVKDHNRLRKDHDGCEIELQQKAGDHRNVHALLTQASNFGGFEIRVLGSKSPHRTGLVLPSINPLETGIELIRLYEFDIRDDEWLLDGEIVPSTYSPAHWLLRRPIMLINLKFLKSVFDSQNPKSFPSDPGDAFERKKLPALHEGDFHLFMDFSGGDLDFRTQRKKKIRQGLSDLRHDRLADLVDDLLQRDKDHSRVRECLKEACNEVPDSSGVHVKGLVTEAIQIDRWLEDYGSRFLEIAQSGEIKEGPLTTLIPVTWKTLELAFNWEYI